MKHYINLYILALIFIFPIKDIHATHAAGMDISYQCITSCITFDTYRITVKFYRDCGPGNWNAPNSFPLNYSSSSCGYNLNQNH